MIEIKEDQFRKAVGYIERGLAHPDCKKSTTMAKLWLKILKDYLPETLAALDLKDSKSKD